MIIMMNDDDDDGDDDDDDDDDGSCFSVSLFVHLFVFVPVR